MRLCIAFPNLLNLPNLTAVILLQEQWFRMLYQIVCIWIIKIGIRHFKILCQMLYLLLLYFEMILWQFGMKMMLKLIQMTLAHCWWICRGIIIRLADLICNLLIFFNSFLSFYCKISDKYRKLYKTKVYRSVLRWCIL